MKASENPQEHREAGFWWHTSVILELGEAEAEGSQLVCSRIDRATK